MMRLKLIDIESGREVEVEVEKEAHPTKLIDKLRELGVLSPREMALLGTSPDGRRIYYVPAATVEQLAAYLSLTKQLLYYKKYPIHGQQHKS
ncbi:MAG: hypothetical protein ABWK05_07635 [Pyrobaculum sp.]